MQTLVAKIDNFTQWLPRGERFTDEAINAIAYAQRHAATVGYAQVEPENILYGLLVNTETTIANLLEENNLLLNQENLNLKLKESQITKFSTKSRYIVEQSLNLARLKQHKQIDVRDLLLASVQLIELENDSSSLNVLNSTAIDTKPLIKKISN